ncbi:MAG: NADH-quinone oxidoreductase subunit K [Halioglobus sp.]|nr:NADH-quinone oxidoreductase subunit K [Halioglobus sp.]
MTPVQLYALLGIGLFCTALYALVVRRHLLPRILALNIMGSGVFLLLVALARRGETVDPVPHAMVITGIVVAVSATALGLRLMLRVVETTGAAHLPDAGDD